jgi:hypothetical protein
MHLARINPPKIKKPAPEHPGGRLFYQHPLFAI